MTRWRGSWATVLSRKFPDPQRSGKRGQLCNTTSQQVSDLEGWFPSGRAVKSPPAVQEMQETRVCSLGWEDPLGTHSSTLSWKNWEDPLTTHSSILAWRIPWTEEPGGLQSTGSQSAGHNWSNWAHTHRVTSIICAKDPVASKHVEYSLSGPL